MSTPQADMFSSIRIRQLELSLERLAVFLGREVRKTGSSSNHCDFCALSPSEACNVACAVAFENWKNRQV